MHPAKAWKKNETTAIGSSAPDMAAGFDVNAITTITKGSKRTITLEMESVA
jgi:hypothetical protein